MHPSTVRSLGKKFIILILVIFSFWQLIRPKANTQRMQSVTIKNRASREVWDYVADINHLKITNPYLKDFHIIADDGVYPEWHYVAILKEDMPILGSVESKVEYTVKPSGNNYVIITMYNHCKIFLCVYVNSTLTFTSESPGEKTNTIIHEELKLWIPNVLNWFWDAAYIATSHLLRIENIKHHLEKTVS